MFKLIDKIKKLINGEEMGTEYLTRKEMIEREAKRAAKEYGETLRKFGAGE